MGNTSPRSMDLYNNNLKASSKLNIKINNDVKSAINKYKIGDIESLTELLDMAKNCDDTSYEFHVFKIFSLYTMLITQDNYLHDIGINQSTIINEYIKLNNNITLHKNSDHYVKRKKVKKTLEYAYKATGDENYNIQLQEIKVV